MACPSENRQDASSYTKWGYRMGVIPKDEVEWAIVERLRELLKDEPHRKFGITQTYALFTSLTCWSMQSLRNPARHQRTEAWSRLRTQRIVDEPWELSVAANSE